MIPSVCAISFSRPPGAVRHDPTPDIERYRIRGNRRVDKRVEENVDVAILGGGLSGLACACDLARQGRSVVVLEREEQVGGMAASFETGNRETAGAEHSDYFSFDYGPHRFHTTDTNVMSDVTTLLGENCHRSFRSSRIFLFGRYFDYPLDFFNILKNFPRLLLLRVVFDYLRTRIADRTGIKHYADANFQQWVERRFGKSLARIFFVEYTEKTWGIPASEISPVWARQRISLVSLREAVWKSVFAKDNAPRTLTREFIYPEYGGIGSIANAYAEEILKLGGRVMVDTPVKRIHHVDGRISQVDYDRHGVRSSVRADQVVSSIPVTGAIQLLAPRADEAVRARARKLRMVSIVFVYLEINKPSVTPDHWTYLPEKTFRVHRISEFKNFSPSAAPRDRTMVCAEITCRAGDAIWRADDDRLRDIAEKDLQKAGLLEANDVAACIVKRIPFAYPLCDVGFEENLASLLDYMHEFENLTLLGRQGLFRYNNMDQSILMGREVAKSLATRNRRGHVDIATEQKYFG
ncbi:MAG: FAD-dependent oxidoreductase [Proteobacteria bacterium]|nr:MAG: FAD-dependent oxidoreductase [Pseudomonadota bacterium]